MHDGFRERRIHRTGKASRRQSHTGTTRIAARGMFLDGPSTAGGMALRFALIACFLSVTHHVPALWFAAAASLFNLLWSMRGGAVAAEPEAAVFQPLSRSRISPSLERARAVVETGSAAEAHLVQLGDKQVLWSADGRGFLMYARQGSRLVSLFDPVGPEECWRELVTAFIELSRTRGLKPVFY